MENADAVVEQLRDAVRFLEAASRRPQTLAGGYSSDVGLVFELTEGEEDPYSAAVLDLHEAHNSLQHALELASQDEAIRDELESLRRKIIQLRDGAQTPQLFQSVRKLYVRTDALLHTTALEWNVSLGPDPTANDIRDDLNDAGLGRWEAFKRYAWGVTAIVVSIGGMQIVMLFSEWMND